MFRPAAVSRLFVGLYLVVAVSTAQAASIGISFVGGGGPGPAGGVSMLPGDIAGVVPQSNFNNITGGSGTNIALNNNSGAPTAALLSFSGGGTYTASGATPADGDEKFMVGFVHTTTTGSVTNIPYATYSVYIYLANDGGGRPTDTFINSAANTVTSTSVPGGDAGFVDGNINTPFNYLQGTGNAAGVGRNNGNYVLFTGVTGSSFTFSTQATGNGSLSGMQIVDTSPVPEPSAIALAGLGIAGVLAMRRRFRH